MSTYSPQLPQLAPRTADPPTFSLATSPNARNIWGPPTDVPPISPLSPLVPVTPLLQGEHTMAELQSLISALTVENQELRRCLVSTVWLFVVVVLTDAVAVAVVITQPSSAHQLTPSQTRLDAGDSRFTPVTSPTASIYSEAEGMPAFGSALLKTSRRFDDGLSVYSAVSSVSTRIHPSSPPPPLSETFDGEDYVPPDHLIASVLHGSLNLAEMPPEYIRPVVWVVAHRQPRGNAER